MSFMNRPTLLIIVGAGASNDCVPPGDPERLSGHPNQPPLTGALFGDRRNLETYLTGRGAAKGLVSDITSHLDRVKPEETGGAGLTIEEALTREYLASKGNQLLRRAFTALRFYLRDLFRAATKEWPRQVGGATNYTWLVRNVEKWRSPVEGYVLWVTFNYDGILDQALADFYDYDFGEGGQADPKLRTFLEHHDWSLIKLHGSYDWRRRATRLTLPSGLQARSANATYAELERAWDAESDPPTAATVYERIVSEQWPSDARDSDRSLWVPALMAPLASKSQFECPPAHVDFLESRLPEVDAVFTLGWRAQERHFLSRLVTMRLNPPDVWAVTRGPNSAAEVAERVRSASGTVDPGDSKQMVRTDARNGFSALRALVPDFPNDLTEFVDEARLRRTPRAKELKALVKKGRGDKPSARG